MLRRDGPLHLRPTTTRGRRRRRRCVESGAELIAAALGRGRDDRGRRAEPGRQPGGARLLRRGWSARAPARGCSRRWSQMFLDIDVRDVVPSVHVPTLVLHRRHDRLVNVRNGRWLAEHLPNARLVELPGDDHIPWYEDAERALGEVQEFLTGARHAPEPERVLATVLFTDIVDSTRTAAELGDQRWREVLEGHQRGGARRARALRRPRGQVDRRRVPGHVRRARRARSAAPRRSSTPPSRWASSVRAGLHTGECEVMGDDIGGIAVHIAARVSALAGPDEVLVSRTVKDLVAGSGIEFADPATRSFTVRDTSTSPGSASAPRARRCARRCRRCRPPSPRTRRCAGRRAPGCPAARRSRGSPGRSGLRGPGPSNVARNPSPIVLTSRPLKRASASRTTRWCPSSTSRQRWSPSSAAVRVESTMSVNRTVASIRSGSGAWRAPVRNSSISPSVRSTSS